MEKKTKYILIGLGVVAVGTGAYVYYQIQKKKRDNAQREFEQAVNTNSVTLPSPTSSYTPSKPSSSGGSSTSGFPLKKGSRGTLVTNLQNALIKKYGAAILPKYGADGDFGSETYNALIAKGLPTVIDEDAFTKIVLGGGSVSSGATSSSSGSSSSSQIASNIHTAIGQDDFSAVLTELKKIKSVSSYTAVNTVFKQTRIGLVRKTLVTALLDQFTASSEKKSLNQEFYRMGLKYDGSKWSLSGLSGIVDRLVTIEPTRVWDENGRTLNVPKATILGEYLDANDGVTEFETLDGRRLFVPTLSIKYTA